jgi:hypothetical protein
MSTTILLTPQQVEDIESGWYVAVVFDPSDIDVLHSALAFPYCDDSTKRLWQNIEQQIKQNHFLAKVGRAIDGGMG